MFTIIDILYFLKVLLGYISYKELANIIKYYLLVSNWNAVDLLGYILLYI